MGKNQISSFQFIIIIFSNTKHKHLLLSMEGYQKFQFPIKVYGLD